MVIIAGFKASETLLTNSHVPYRNDEYKEAKARLSAMKTTESTLKVYYGRGSSSIKPFLIARMAAWVRS